jgi:hypothetical protein
VNVTFASTKISSHLSFFENGMQESEEYLIIAFSCFRDKSGGFDETVKFMIIGIPSCTS